MIVPSPTFLLFAAVAAILYNIRSGLAWRQLVLLAANLLFVARFSYNPEELAPLGGFLLLGYAAYLLTRRGTRPQLFVALLVLTVVAFAWLKRYTFIPSGSYLQFPYLLVGLSYVFFRVMHLIIDGHQQSLESPVGVLSYLNYTLNFTSLISGPIQRYQDYHEMELAPAPLSLIECGRAIERIVKGYFKVAMVSMVLLLLQHQSIDALGSGGDFGQRVWNGTVTVAIYPIFLYFNFSGYVDVVIGVARFFGIVLPENFNRPFSSENLLIYWSRWHMTLSGWLKTYVYNPLMMAGMEKITAPALAQYIAVFAFFVTFFLVGLWHGQTSEFIGYGLSQGGGVAANKLYQLTMAKRLGRTRYRALAANPLYASLCRGLTFTYTALTLLLFWSNWPEISALLATLGITGSIAVCMLILLASTAILSGMETVLSAALRPTWSVDPGQREPVLGSRYVRTMWGTALVMVTIAVTVLLSSPSPEIVYKTF